MGQKSESHSESVRVDNSAVIMHTLITYCPTSGFIPFLIVTIYSCVCACVSCQSDKSISTVLVQRVHSGVTTPVVIAAAL